jgi:hypothetical protein
MPIEYASWAKWLDTRLTRRINESVLMGHKKPENITRGFVAMWIWRLRGWICKRRLEEADTYDTDINR